MNMRLTIASLLLLALSTGCGFTDVGAPVGVAAAASPAVVPPAMAAVPPAAAPEASVARTLNEAILSVIDDYPRDGSHPYAWSRGVNTDGVTRELLWQGTVLAEPDPDGGIHCSGITYEVYLRALREVVGDQGGPDAQTLLAMKDAWYVRDGTDLGPVGALERAGLGDPVNGLVALKPGDIVQFWRNSGKGHSVIFINHTYNSDGSLRGMIYWSAQGTSGGVGMRRVSPGTDINQIAPGRLYGARARWPAAAVSAAQGSPSRVSSGG